MFLLPFWISSFVVSPGSTSYPTPGSYSFTVPNYNTLVVDVWGAGSGAGGACGSSGVAGSQGGSSGSAGGLSRFASSSPVTGGGATGGSPGSVTVTDDGKNPVYTDFPGSAGSAGTASGGDTNTTGGGQAGGSGATVVGDQLERADGRAAGGAGGAGGRATKSWVRGVTSGAPTPGDVITITVGTGGAAGGNYNGGGVYSFSGPTGGFNGYVAVSWS